jgi:hypothetical protein
MRLPHLVDSALANLKAISKHSLEVVFKVTNANLNNQVIRHGLEVFNSMMNTSK